MSEVEEASPKEAWWLVVPLIDERVGEAFYGRQSVGVLGALPMCCRRALGFDPEQIFSARGGQ